MKTNQSPTKLTTTYKKKHDQGKYDGKFLDQLVTTIEELKNRVHFFENYFTCENDQKNAKQFVDIKNDNHFSDTNHPKLSTNFKKIGFRNDSKCTVNSVLLCNIMPEQKKIESDSSLIKSTLSLTKNTYINFTPTADSKHFKLVAKDFIKQAEDLKNNISFILEQEQGDNINNIAINDFENHVNYNNGQIQNEDCETALEQHLHYLLGSLSNQYEEILKSLGNIEHQLRHKSSKQKNKKIAKLSLTSTKVSTYVPNNMHKVETFKNGVVNAHGDINLQNYKSRKLKKSSDKKLDPVVLVYEPIKPTNMSQDVCMNCGRGSNSCVFGSCRNHLVKSDECYRKHDVCCGFMVSYTPNFNYSDNIEASSNKNHWLESSHLSIKDYKKCKKRKKKCLWF